MPGGNRAFIPGRINYFFKYTGPSYSVDTACSSSLASFHLACNALWAGEVDTAFAGGCNIVTNPDLTAGLDRGHFLSRTGNCKTFDETADGYCRAEGVVTVIVKRLEDAIHDNDPIHAVIRGASTNHSSEADSITRPYVGAQKAVFRNILNIAGVDPVDVDYVEMHGTGTKTGDPGEMQSVLDVFAPPAPSGRRPDQPLHIGSVKPNIGHMEAASGLSSLVKVLLMLKNDVIVPHTGIKTRLNPSFPKDMDARQVFITQKLKPWVRRNDSVRKVFVNNFSAAGGNSGLLLEDSPERSHTVQDPRSQFPVAVSAKSATALRRNLQRLVNYVEKYGSEQVDFLQALSYTTTARRTHYPHRVIVNGSHITGIRESLQQAIAAEHGASKSRSMPKIVFAFTGQGSQYTGMGKFLFDTFASFRDEVTRMDRLACRQGFPSFLSALKGNVDMESQSPTVVQLSTIALEIALAHLWMSLGVKPTSVVGHSLGEYAAMCIAGVLSMADAIYLVGSRAQLLEKYCHKGSHAMLAVRASVESIESVLGAEMPGVACINGPQDTVLAGPTHEIGQAQQCLNGSQLKSTLLKVPFAFHSSQVDPILDDFVRLAQNMQYNRPTIPIMCPLMGTADRECSTRFSAEYLRDHSRRAVNMLDTVRAAQTAQLIDEKSFVLEIGPHPVVCAMFAATVGRQVVPVHSLHRTKEASSQIVSALSAFYRAGVTINWQEYQRGYPYKVLELPNYGWDLKDYWIQYVNDWSLYKGDPVYRTHGEDLPSKTTGSGQSGALESTTVHKIESDSNDTASKELVVESDLSRSDLSSVVRGHLVEGLDLCTPSVYADIALTVAKHVADQHGLPSSEGSFEVSDFAVTKALVTKTEIPQTLRTTIRLDVGNNRASCHFATKYDANKALTEHANCIIRFNAESPVMANVEGIKSRIGELRTEMSQGKAFNFSRSMAYRIISDYVNVEPSFRGLKSLLLNSDAMDAWGIIHFKDVELAAGDFYAHPAIIDAFTQVAGFVLNANENSDIQHEVFVNQGWRSMRLLQPITGAKQYQAYVKMEEREGGLWKGDLTVLDDSDRVVAVLNELTLRAVPRRLLKYVFLGENGVAASASQNLAPSQLRDKPLHRDTERAITISQGISRDKVSELERRAVPTVPKLDTKQAPVDTSAIDRQQIDCHDVESRPVASALPPESGRSPTNDYGNDVQSMALRIFSEESGIAVEALHDESNFDDLGVDSLLSLLIVNRIDEEMNIGLHPSTFAGMETVKDLKDFLKSKSPSVEAGSSASSTVLQTDSAPGSGADTPLTDMEEADRHPKVV